MNLQTIGKLAVQMLLDAAGFKAGVEETVTAAEELQQELEQVAETVNETVGGAMDGLAAKANETAKTVNGMAGVYRDAAGKLRDAQGKFVSGEQAVKALGDTAGLTAEEIAALGEEVERSRLSKLGDASEKLVADFRSLGDVLGGAVLTGVKAVTAAVAGLGAASAVVGAAFEQRMKQVGVIAGSSEQEMALLTEEARRLGATTSFSASEAADAMQLLASAGLDTRQIMEAAGQALVLAGAGGTDLNTASAVLTATLATFNLTADQSGRIADVLARATAGSQFQVEDLSEALKYGAPTAAAFGYSLEETVAAMAQFRDMGMQGSTAGTALRSVLSQASQQTKINADTLAKYNLQLSDVNPQLHSFGEILQTVGAAGINASDAMVVFGVEAGGAFAQMAQQAALGSTKLSEFETSLMSAGGAAASMYGDMQQTVQGAFLELQSAAEEVLLTLFEQYSGSLPDLLGSLTEFVNGVAVTIGSRSDEIRDALGGAVETITAYLAENGDRLAALFATAMVDAAEFARTLAEVGVQLAGLIPFLDDIALAMGVIWVASKVAAFASAVANVVTVLGAAQAGVGALMAEITVATGGIYALVAAIGVLVAGLVTLIARYDAAEESARKLKAAQDDLAQKRADTSAERAAELDAVLVKQRAAAEAEADQLAQAGKLTAEKKRELDAIREMDGLTAARLEAEGKLLLVSGELRTVRQIVQGEDAEAFRQITATVNTLKASAKDTGAEMETLKGAIERAQQQGLEGGTQQAVFFSTLGLDVASVEEARARLTDLEKTRKDTLGRAYTLERQLGDEVRALQEEATQDVKDANQARLKDIQTTAAQASRSETEYTDRTADLHARLADELAAIGADETQQLQLEQDRREREVRAAYERQIGEAKGNVAEQERLRARLEQDLLLLSQIYAGKRAEAEEKATNEAAEKERKRLEDEAAARQRERERVLGILTGLEREGASKVEQIRMDMADTLAGISLEDADLRAKIEAEYLEKIKAAQNEAAQARRSAFVRSARDMVDAFGTAIESISRTVSGAIGLVEDYLGRLYDLFTALTGFSFDLSGMAADVQTAQETAAEEGTTLTSADAAAQVVDELVAGAVEFVTLFAEVADDLIGGIVAAVPDLVDAFLAALPEIVNAIAEGLPAVVKSLASAFPEIVAVLAEQAGVLVEAIADALPMAVEAIADAMPVVAQALADALPAAVDALLAALPDIFDGLVAAAPILIDALLTEVPRLIMGIIDLLPGMISALLALLPDIIKKLIAAVADIVVAIIAALPDLITAILDALPDIIVALIEALLEALPEIILALVDAIPDIINAVIAAIPDIILAIVGEVPAIIEALVALAPQLIAGIVESIPDMIPALVSALGEVIVGLLGSVGDIGRAIWDAIVEGFQSADFIKTLAATFVDALGEAWDAIVDVLGDILSAAWESITDIFDGGSRERAASGAGPMSALADALALSRGFGALTPGAGLDIGAQRDEGDRAARATAPLVMGSTARIAVMLDGRTVQDSLVRSDARGQTTVVTDSKRAGRVVGVSRGKFNYFTR